MPKGKKKSKNKNRRPPLTKLDKFLYAVIPFLGIILFFALTMFIEARGKALGEANGAIDVKATMSVFTALIPSVPVTVGGIIFAGYGYEKRVPIFGPSTNDKYKQKNPPSLAKLIFITAAVVVWLFSFVFVAGASSSRVEITETHINTYAMFGKPEESRNIKDATKVQAKIYSKRVSQGNGRGSTKWEMDYAIYFADGEIFYFGNSPSKIIAIDALFEGVPKTAEGTENFEKLCKEHFCSPEVREQLKKVFLIDE